MNSLAKHDSARAHVTGSAIYIDDRPLLKNELFVDVFYSPIAKGKIKALDYSRALELEGVVAIFDHSHLRENQWGTIFKDQPYLAVDQVNYAGEPILVIAAESKSALVLAKQRIEVDLEEEPAILSIKDAIENQAFIGPKRSIASGNINDAFKGCEHVLEGQIEMAGQDHFYLESQASIAYPNENGQIEVHSSSQHPTEVQHMVAKAIGLQYNEVVCIVKRLGGGFGGKESQAGPFAVYASLVAQKLNRPARMVISKDDDMIITGKRNPFKNFYKVGFDSTGKIMALSAKLFSDGGAYADLSTAIMERAMLHLDNAYFIENFKVEGQVCRTNTAPNTAFRGFGGPKGVVTIESIIEDIAQHLKISSFMVREKNVYKKGQLTPYGQTIDDEVLPELFSRLREKSNYFQWEKSIFEHNQSDLKTIKGLSATAVKFGISFTTRFLNQGNALVNLHLDGSFQVSTGATEMGQGVNTKIAQIVADEFDLPLGQVNVMPTSTEKNPNTSATAASSGSDINGQAALNGAKKIKERLCKVARQVLDRPEVLRGQVVAGAGTAPEINIDQLPLDPNIQFKNGYIFDSKNPQHKISFKELVLEAYLNRVPLTAQGYFRYPEIFFNKETGKGIPFFYFTNGVAATEVEINKRTGELKVLRSEIIMDLGRPINQGIDLGQVTGAFIQGLGWVTTENLFYDKGRLISHSPSTYKIPSVHDIPRVFNCELLENSRNIKNVKASKAVGEPPLLLAVSVWTAIKNALYFKSPHSKIELKLPATGEEIYTHLKGIL